MEEMKKETAEAVDTGAEELAPDTPAENPQEATIKKLEAELADSRDKYLRMLAEYDNYRKRTQKERESVYSDAVADAAKELLPILDLLEKAITYKDFNAEKLAEGLCMTFTQAAVSLEKLGIEETAEVGAQFDPNLHNAVLHIEDDSFGDNEIVEIFQRGYRRGDKIIRYAMVKVAN